MKWTLILLVILIIPFVSALCEEDQIDINSASLDELDNIAHVGQKVAGYIKDARPFNSLDDLVDVSYISENYLIDIKEEGLACVNENSKTEIKEEVIEEIVKKEIIIEEETIVEETEKPVDLKIIELNTKVIKTDDSEESYNLYAIWGLVTFSILLTLLFLLKKQKEDKNEFDSH